MNETALNYNSIGNAHFNGEARRYSLISESFPICDENGVNEAEIITHSYMLAEKHPVDRPVAFAWNGGPGCSSVFIHMGFLGPRRVCTYDGASMKQWGPYETESNPDWLLKTCDIVLIDPVGTGWSRGFTPEAEQKYFNSQNDADSVAEVMDAWLTRHARERAPIYIICESYGTTRAALVSKALFSNKRCAPFRHLSGVIMIGTILDFHGAMLPIENDVLTLPTVAAVNHYHNPNGKPNLEQFFSEAESFAYDTYLRALTLGNRLTQEEQRSVAQRLSYFSGRPVEELMNEHLHLNIYDYQYRCLAEKEKCVSVNDGRITGPMVKQQSYSAGHEDPGHHRFMPAFTAAFREWKSGAGIPIDCEYCQANLEASALWQFKVDMSPKECLELAMTRNPQMRLLFCSGYYDMITTTGYLKWMLSGMKIPQNRYEIEMFKSGHMCYVGSDCTKQLCDKISEFMTE